MTQEQLEKFKKDMEDLLIKANQSGKVETSRIVDEIFSKIDNKIEGAIKFHVNGKINHLNEKVDEYIKSDTEWKKEVEPYIKSVQQFDGFAKIGGSILKSIIVIGSAVGVLVAFIRYLRG